ncbi:MAG TPA: group II intron reverse transcriptase/maturase [Solirubrobacterales bacterium]|nr:group II intron reverse transcriptase/maturase [Solirubrobacterales bacterium]
MAQQKSEDRIGPEGGVTPAEPAGSSTGGQGKAIPVEEVASQLELPVATAENPRGATRAAAPDRSGAGHAGAPEATVNAEEGTPATMEEVARRLTSALRNVAQNKGAPGPDGQTIEELRERWPVVRPKLEADLIAGTYRPGEIRRAEIPKVGGGQRDLGIPNVVDRVVQEAVRQVLEPRFEPSFHPSSHGFRPGRSCHTAVAEAKAHLEDGHEWAVDLDLEKFFDRVCHQRLMARLAERVSDRRLLVAIGRMLKAKVLLPDGVVIASEEGVPQGSPLSPLLSNVVLDELDRELARRGHRFVRYADDANVYVRSERAGLRVMASLTDFIERRLRLKVNRSKSAVARPEERHFLGFCLRRCPETGTVEVLLSERTKRDAMERIRKLTPRTWGGSLASCIARINVWLVGWHGFFGIAPASEEFTLRALDAHIRRRLRAIVLSHWKRRRTIARNLEALGVARHTAWRRVYAGRKSRWALSHDPAVDRGLRNAYFAERGLVFLVDLHRRRHEGIAAPAQPQLALEWG